MCGSVFEIPVVVFLRICWKRYLKDLRKSTLSLRGWVRLPICKSIVDKMNGRIWADSQLGIGTTFMVELPCSVTPIDA